MPPYVSRKRPSSDSPCITKQPNKKARKSNAHEKGRPLNEPDPNHALQENKDFLENLGSTSDGSSLSSVDSDGFEDVLDLDGTNHSVHPNSDEEHDVNWEDAIPLPQQFMGQHRETGHARDLEITLDSSNAHLSQTTLANTRKGPSKIERQIRVSVHCMHVQCLMFHNVIRNGWASDKEAQETLVAQLPPTVTNQWEKWRRANGFLPAETQRQNEGGDALRSARNKRGQREWDKPASRQEVGNPDRSHGDPTIKFLKVLAAYWSKRFVINSGGLRKQGYKPLQVLEDEVARWKNNVSKLKVGAEQVPDIETFRKSAQLCEGSRDLGAQLFLTLSRGLGLEARLVASLQPLGYGWANSEDATLKNFDHPNDAADLSTESEQFPHNGSSDPIPKHHEHLSASSLGGRRQKPRISHQSRLGEGGKHRPIDLDRCCADHDDPTSLDSQDSDSVIDITPNLPSARHRTNYDRDMPSPTYWTEIVSPSTNQVYPVDPFSYSHPVATKFEHLSQFEPRGVRAEKVKQVFAYVIGYFKDGTAKELTTRYLKRRMWPGRTKGTRLPVQKLPVFNKKGRVERYEKYDWFRRVMRCYERPAHLRTTADDVEDSKDLVPAKQATRRNGVGEDTLQAYKSSSTYVLERHLRREEALRPNAQIVRMFRVGKGEDTKEEPVFLRKDVEICRTAESWHKEGRAVKTDQSPLKTVPIRAVTVNRKREIEEAQREGGGKLMQGMYAKNQTDWIIPPPIRNGKIPKNAYGNMDCFVPSMVPHGAVHIPLRNTVKVCRRLEIDFAEAVTGFDFGHRMAVPVISGVVVAEYNGKAVVSEWEKDEEERRIKEEGKRERQALAMWRKWLLGLRVLKRVDEEYGGEDLATVKDDVNPFINQRKAIIATDQLKSSMHDRSPAKGEGSSGAGGFLLEPAEMTEIVEVFSPDEQRHSLPGKKKILQTPWETRSENPRDPQFRTRDESKETFNVPVLAKKKHSSAQKERKSMMKRESSCRIEQSEGRKGSKVDSAPSVARRSTRQAAVKVPTSYAEETTESEGED